MHSTSVHADMYQVVHVFLVLPVLAPAVERQGPPLSLPAAVSPLLRQWHCTLTAFSQVQCEYTCATVPVVVLASGGCHPHELEDLGHLRN
jgi:hypothetical protein